MANSTQSDAGAGHDVSRRPQHAGSGRHAHASELAVDIRNLSKYYPGTVALDRVNVDIRAGEIHALIGGNGSGKSTLIKGLCGVISCEPDGEIRVRDTSTSAANWSKESARAAGVHAVHQDLGVFLDLTVAENLAIGAGFARYRSRSISWPDVYARAAVLIDRFAIDATPASPMRSLSPANRTLVAIARAVQDGADDHGLLILDEPTASLPQHESDFLLDTLERFAAKGQSILYVSHRLDEILRIADRVSVLRDGRSIGTFDIADLDEQRLVQLIVGTDLPATSARSVSQPGSVAALQLRNVSVGPLRNVNLTVAKGEIVGVAGVVGSGRSSLLRGIFGAHTISGDLTVAGSPVRFADCSDAIKAGVAYVPENRADDAAFPDLTIAANIAMPRIAKFWSPAGMRDWALRATATQLMRSFLVKAPTSQALLTTLSGGNQQKVILARWLGTNPTLLLLDEPSQGVDVGARAEIHSLIREAADQGLAVLIAASDPNELALIVDRAVVLRDGSIAAELSGAELTPERLAVEIHKGQGQAA